MKRKKMRNDPDRIYFMDFWFDPRLIGDEAFEDYLYDCNEEDMGVILQDFLQADLINVYWTDDDRFYFEDKGQI